MHASHYSRVGRQRANKDENIDFDDVSIDTYNAKSNNDQQLSPGLNEKKNSCSSTGNIEDNYQQDYLNAKNSDLLTTARSLTNLNRPTDYYNISYTGTNDSLQDSFSSEKGYAPEYKLTDNVLEEISTGTNNVPISINDSLDRERRRSGSWTGVNESEDEMEQISKYCPVQSSIGNINVIPNTSYGAMGHTSGNGTTNVVPEVRGLQSYESSCDTCSIGSTPITSENVEEIEEKVRKRLKFFFMNPVEKWQAKRRFPWKLSIQIIKIFIVTIQLWTFATQRYNHVSYLWDTKVSFSHLFIKGWEESREVNTYPPSTGPLAIYKIDDFYEFLDFSIKAFATVKESAIGSYTYEKLNKTIVMPELCFKQYSDTIIDIENLTYKMSSKINQDCLSIPTSVLSNVTSWSTRQFLKEKNMILKFDLLCDASFSFQLRTIKIKATTPFDAPECFSLESTIYLDNNDHDGQLLVDLDIGAMVLDCKGSVNSIQDSSYLHTIRSSFNFSTIIICLFSFLMCCRSLYRARSLKNITNQFFLIRFNRNLTWWEKFDFINLWYVLIIINDTLIVIGSVIKISLEAEDYEGYLDKWNVCSLFLGTGNLFVWFGSLRYLGFFKTYNVLILTIKKCVPDVLRYSICILMVFAGYCFCGWLVLGPYHFKFRSLSSTIECLYSLINGDDMFATFASTIGKDWIVWWFSRIYLYSFISLFIYMILSLFIAIIMDSYETIKSYYENGFPKNELDTFIGECQADPYSGAYLDSERTIQDIVNYLCCCCHVNHAPPAGYEPLPT